MSALADTKNAARQYIEAGYKIIPLYSVLMDADTYDYICGCGKDHPKGKSVGKHPHAGYAPNGLRDAVDDPQAVEAWIDPVNLGFALTSTTVAVDIDDREIADMILALEDRDAYCMAKTYRGVHLYVKTNYDETGLLKIVNGEKGGRKIGEVRAAGSYTILPPSRRADGGNYEWVTGSILDGIPSFDGSAYDYIAQILEPFEIRILARDAIDEGVEGWDGLGIEPCDLPFEIDPGVEPMLYGLALGNWPTNDRSGTWFRMACEASRAARRADVELDVKTLAGFIKKIDGLYYKKFVGRRDGDKRIWECASRAKADVDRNADLDPESVAAPQAQGDAAYSWDERAGFTYRGVKSIMTICNFEPLIEEVREIVTDDVVKADWMVRFTNLDGEVFETRLRDRDRARLRESLQAQLPPTFIVGARAWGYLEEGMRWFSRGKTKVKRVYGETGWIKDTDTFLLPTGGITASGIDESVIYDPESIPNLLRHYGEGVVPSDDSFDATAALRTLYAMAPAGLTVPTITQALAAPLESIGAGKSAVIVHLFSRTGSFKTSMARVILSLYGNFIDEHKNTLETWTGTANSLQSMMFLYRDLPMVIDDYKKSLGGHHLSGMTALIQNYADRTSRSRLTRDQQQQRRVYPRCLVISTGEDTWEGQESVQARTLIIDAAKQKPTLDALRAAQEAAMRGDLARVGYMWISWMCGKGRLNIERRLAELREIMIARSENMLAEYHARIRSSLSTLMAVDRLWGEFLEERVPEFVDEYKEIRQRGWATVMGDVGQQAEDAEQFSPFETIRAAIISGIQTGEVWFGPRLKGDNVSGLGQQGAESGGFVDQEYIWLNETITLRWYEKRLRIQGRESKVAWASFLQEARHNYSMHHSHDAGFSVRVTGDGWGKHLRLAGFRLVDFLPADMLDTPVEFEQTQDIDHRELD